ncbi:MAG: hypothetical protein JKY09_08610, partial [Crocinitomicaceae bacterium]|nr:hypothetical protein [Crocinitomicaceae bacterium]
MKLITFILPFISFFTFGQSEVSYLYEELPGDSIPKQSIKLHTSVKPAIRLNSVSSNESYVKLTGLTDLNYLQNENTQYKTGLGAEFKSSINNKWFFRLAAIQGIAETDSIFTPKSFVSVQPKSLTSYTDIRSRIAYTPNHIFNFQVGLDHNFIGEGARSMFLSDYGKPYPFAQVRARFWRIEYSVLYQFLREGGQHNWEGKFASSHHISFNAAKWLNFGIFESVVFQPKDTLLNRGFDAEYLNPLVFYRPQEYSLG